MLGAIIGDIVGSRFEWNNIKTKNFELFTRDCFVTDDSIMTLGVAKAIIESNKDRDILRKTVAAHLQEVGRPYPDCGYGGMFHRWMYMDDPQPYNSFGNGAAMRISPCGFAASSLEEAKILSKIVTEISHDHPEGLKGAEATSVAIYLAREGKSISEIREYINKYYYPMDFSLDEIRPTYRFNETCQETVPQAIMAFLESSGFEDALRNAISIGGDSDTLAAITGGIAGAYYGIPVDIRESALSYLDRFQLNILRTFESVYGTNSEIKSINCLRVNTKDNVVTLIKEIAAGEEVSGKDVPSGIRSFSKLQLGHKIAIEEIGEGDRIIKYGETIGYASRMIEPGEHVHVHNMVGGRGRGDLE